MVLKMKPQIPTLVHNMENLLLLYIVRFVFDNKLPFRVLVVLTKADKVTETAHILLCICCDTQCSYCPQGGNSGMGAEIE